MASYDEIDNRLSILEDYVDNIDTSISPLSESETKELLVYVALENTYGLDAEYFEKEYQSLVEAGAISKNIDILKKSIGENIDILRETLKRAKEYKKKDDYDNAIKEVDAGIKKLEEIRKQVADIDDYGVLGALIGRWLGETIEIISTTILSPIPLIGQANATFGGIYRLIYRIKKFVDNIKEKRQLGQIVNYNRTQCLRYFADTIYILESYRKQLAHDRAVYAVGTKNK